RERRALEAALGARERAGLGRAKGPRGGGERPRDLLPRRARGGRRAHERAARAGDALGPARRAARCTGQREEIESSQELTNPPKQETSRVACNITQFAKSGG